MYYAYKIMFIVGVLYTFISALISGLSGALHIGHIDGSVDGHSDFGGHSDGHIVDHTGDLNAIGSDSGLSHAFFSWFSILINPIVAVSFLTVFGGIGILGTTYFKWLAIIVFLVALSLGIIVSSLLYKYIAMPLYKSENSTDISRSDLASTPAEVVCDIIEGGFGEIRYTVNQIRYNAPAMHIDGKAVEQGKKVLILKVENNIFYITEMEEI